ncbi:MAG TPA: 50S ribosomal protein L29 [Candidatus Atribacteria bacterium]|nr:50S ribosomal protein L29 [Candidatus Atribacteria bacterium]
MKIREIRDLSNEELLQKISDFKDELFNLRFQIVTGQLKNFSRVKEVKKSIARAYTVLRERELAGNSAQENREE